MRIRISSLLLILAAFISGSLVDYQSDAFRDLKRNVREIAGLPKHWPPVPRPDMSQRAAVQCPDPSETLTIVTGGQSNAANSLPKATRTTSGRVYVWYAGKCFPAADPLPGASGTRGSLWITLSESIVERQQTSVLLIASAVGGTQVEDWLDPRPGYLAALDDRIATADKAGYPAQLVLWHQGETDAAASTPEAFGAGLRRLIRHVLNQAPQARFYLFQASRCMGKRRATGVPEMTEAARQVAHSEPRVIAGMNTDSLADDYRYDGCHFNSLAREQIARQVMTDLQPYLDDGLVLAAR
jgi:lysophospholipase L1-like esterase